MDVTISTGGVASPSRHWLICPRRAKVVIDVAWESPPSVKRNEDPPTISLYYFAPFAQIAGTLPTQIRLSSEDSKEGELQAPASAVKYRFRGSGTITAPGLVPLRASLELQPPHGSGQVHVVYVIPRASAWISTGIVVASLLTIALLAPILVASLRVTVEQLISGLGGLALAGAALQILVSVVRRLRTSDLPYLGIPLLLWRSVLACLLSFVVMITMLQRCMVVIRNDTEDDVEFKFPWRDRNDIIPSGSQITVVPPDPEMLGKALQGMLAEDERHRALCVVGTNDPDYTCRDTSEDVIADWRPHPFTPLTLSVGCGKRWGSGVRAADVHRHGHEGIEIDGDDVWLTPPSSSHCGRSERATLWYRDPEVGNVTHHVQYPWSPESLERLGRIWITVVDHGAARTMKVALRSVMDDSSQDGSNCEPAQPEPLHPLLQALHEARHEAPGSTGDERHAIPSETRILLSGFEERDRGWPLMTLPSGDERCLAVEIGEPSTEITSRFSPAATLQCTRKRGGDDSGLRATRLGIEGRLGWLASITVGAFGDRSWTSSWQLQDASSLDVAAPWICEAFPGKTPGLTPRPAFLGESMVLHLDSLVASTSGPQAVIVPAHLMARQVVIHRRAPGPASNAELVGRLECDMEANANDVVVVGRIMLDDQRNGSIQDFRMRVAQGERVLGHWTPEGPARALAEVWMCWGQATEKGDVTVEITPVAKDGTDKPSIMGSWDVEKASLKLDPIEPRVCYHDTSTGGRPTPKKKKTTDWQLLSPEERRRLQEFKPKLRVCREIYEPRSKTK